MRLKNVIIWTVVFIVFFLLAGFPQAAKAEIQLCGEKFTVQGYLRYELGIHVAEQNPANDAVQDDNNFLTLSRTFFQTEWSYKPSDSLKTYCIVRVTGDQTYHWDNELATYNAFPVDVPQYDWTMMKASEDDFRVEVWELYADLNLRNLWLRLGKQQIVWGEMIGGRILDAVNSLDRSWNFLFEPEEFENIRIPNWAIRGSYNLEQDILPWLKNVNIEAFVNPGDIYPTIDAEVGAPLRLAAYPPFFRIRDNDNRGKTEWGIRAGGMIGQFFGTLNYLSLYNDGANLLFRGLTPDPIRGVPLLAATGDFTRYAMLLSGEHKKIDLYGATLNYALDNPLNLVINFECAWIPNQPYAKAGSLLPAIRDQGTFTYAIRLDRPTSLIPPQFLASSFATIQLQLTQTWVEGNEDKIVGGGNSKIDKDVNTIVFQIRQPVWHNQYTFAFKLICDTDDGFVINPSIKYKPNDHWYFDLFADFVAGSERRPGRLASAWWSDTVYGRITYQF